MDALRQAQHVARKELRERLRDGRFRAAAGGLGLLLLLALGTGVIERGAAERERLTAERRDRAQWEGQGRKNPHSAAHFGVYALPPSDVLGAFDPGLEAFTGRALWLEAHWQDFFQHRPAEDGGGVQRFAQLSLARVLQLLLPLLVVALLFDAWSGERERGTLRQLLSLGARPWALGLGKLAGGGAALALLLAPLLVLAALVAWRGSTAGPGTLARLAFMATGYALYLLAFAGLALTVSALASSSRAALVALLVFWAVNGLVAPRLAADLSEILHPTPAATSFWAGVSRDFEHGLDGHDPADARRQELERRVLREYGVERLQDLPVSFAGLALQASEDHGALVFDRHFSNLWDLYERQERAQLALAAVAPLLAVRALSMGAARTDFSHRRHFARAAESFRRVFVKQLNDSMAARAKGLDFDYKAEPEYWRTLPKFTYEPPALADTLRAQTAPLALLALWAAAALGAAAWSAARVRA